jgi:glycosyltransferase involved in cell wall biosynthesis
MKNKILLISLQKFGGGALDSLEISNALVENEFFHYVVISNKNELKDEFKDNEFRKVFLIETFESNIKSFLINTFLKFQFLNLIKIILRIKPKNIFFTHRHPWQIFVLFLRPFLNFKIIYSCHDNLFDPKDPENKVNLFIDKLLAKKSDVIVVYSNFIKEDLNKFLKKEIIVIPLGPYNYFSYFQKTNFNSEKLVLGFWGRILEYKGLKILLKAFEILKKEGLNLDLYILGKGRVRDEETEIIKNLNVNFIDEWINNEEIVNYMKEIDLIILPYLKATQSGVISFCLGTNMPFIVSDAGGLKEFVENGKTGFIFKNGDYADLAEKIKIIYQNKELLKTFSENIKIFKTNFEWKNRIKKLLDYLER